MNISNRKTSSAEFFHFSVNIGSMLRLLCPMKRKTEINLLAGKLSFTDEPQWFKLIVIALVMVFLGFLIWLVVSYINPALAFSGFSGFRIFSWVRYVLK